MFHLNCQIGDKILTIGKPPGEIIVLFVKLII